MGEITIIIVGENFSDKKECFVKNDVFISNNTYYDNWSV